ncbi:MupG family TIM beta-alpha barrel fold protein [Sporolactobacillus sp. STCC-11]|uniref:DUF871 domain-containing protein n=1 Tax=Sporolactobacillus caesalpiniae TaxID=3230362 RepID=UPI00339B4A16
MLGISIYLNQPIDQQQEKIKHYNAQGFNMIFTSLHIPEENKEVYRERLIELGILAKNLKMKLIVDIDASSLNTLHLRLNEANQLDQMGISALRLDEGFDEKVTAALSKQIPIVLNASTLTTELLRNMTKEGLNVNQVTACHNYYPRPETGLSRQAFRQRNQFLKNVGLSIAAFFPGDQNRRGPIFKGLPTLEYHRNYSPFASFLDLSQEDVDDLILGDSDMSEHALRQFSSWKNGLFLLHAHPKTDDLTLLEAVALPQSNRLDEARDCIRSQESRMQHLLKLPVLPTNHSVSRLIGSITVDNQLYGRYQGEIQITKHDLPADPKVNVIGIIMSEDLPLLHFMHGGSKFQIEWIC